MKHLTPYAIASFCMVIIFFISLAARPALGDEARESRHDTEIQKIKLSKELNAANIAANKAAIAAIQLTPGSQGLTGPRGLPGAQGPIGPAAPPYDPIMHTETTADVVQVNSSPGSTSVRCPVSHPRMLTLFYQSPALFGGLPGHVYSILSYSVIRAAYRTVNGPRGIPPTVVLTSANAEILFTDYDVATGHSIGAPPLTISMDCVK